MCLILLAWRAHPEFPLVFAGNRDEAYARPSAAADFWKDEPRIFGGRDLEQGGTWLGLTLSGRIAAVTNYRDGVSARNAPRSRGELVAGFLRGTEEPRAYLERAARHDPKYGGYTLIAGGPERLYWHSNRGVGVAEIAAGVHGLSNHLLDTPWPKVAHGKERVAALLGAGENELTRGLFAILTDRTVAPDAELPDTRVGIQRERELSPSFVAGERYGTRACTVLLVNRAGEVMFEERAFGAQGAPGDTVTRRFKLDARGAPGNARIPG
jgi:uncharacterized protein with NRDE domain